MRITVESIDLPSQSSELVRVFNLEEPRQRHATDSFGLRFLGWYVARDERIRAISIEFNAEPMDTVSPVERRDVVAIYPDTNPDFIGGFEAVVPTMELSGEIELRVILHFSKRSTCIASVRVKITPIAVRYHPLFAPILVTAAGRTGSTVTMKLISSHPQIVSQDRHPFEDKSALFWMRAAAVLSMPSDLIRSTRGNEFERDPFFVGYNPFANQINLPNRDAMSARWLREALPKCSYVFFMTLVDGYYEAIAQDVGKPFARLFVEKAAHGVLPSMVRQLYSQSKEVFLVRDPRDTLASILQFNERRGFKDFGADECKSDAALVKYLAGKLGETLKAWNRRKESSLLLRYEDLIASPTETTRRLFQYIGVADSSEIIEAALARAFVMDETARYHMTSASTSNSVRRWPTALPKTLAKLCNVEFHEFLDYFEYR